MFDLIIIFLCFMFVDSLGTQIGEEITKILHCNDIEKKWCEEGCWSVVDIDHEYGITGKQEYEYDFMACHENKLSVRLEMQCYIKNTNSSESENVRVSMMLSAGKICDYYDVCCDSWKSKNLKLCFVSMQKVPDFYSMIEKCSETDYRSILFTTYTNEMNKWDKGGIFLHDGEISPISVKLQ